MRFAFHVALIHLEKVFMQIFSLRLWIDSRANWDLLPWYGNWSWRKITEFRLVKLHLRIWHMVNFLKSFLHDERISCFCQWSQIFFCPSRVLFLFPAKISVGHYLVTFLPGHRCSIALVTVLSLSFLLFNWFFSHTYPHVLSEILCNKSFKFYWFVFLFIYFFTASSNDWINSELNTTERSFVRSYQMR